MQHREELESTHCSRSVGPLTIKPKSRKTQIKRNISSFLFQNRYLKLKHDLFSAQQCLLFVPKPNQTISTAHVKLQHIWSLWTRTLPTFILVTWVVISQFTAQPILISQKVNVVCMIQPTELMVKTVFVCVRQPNLEPFRTNEHDKKSQNIWIQTSLFASTVVTLMNDPHWGQRTWTHLAEAEMNLRCNFLSNLFTTTLLSYQRLASFGAPFCGYVNPRQRCRLHASLTRGF